MKGLLVCFVLLVVVQFLLTWLEHPSRLRDALRKVFLSARGVLVIVAGALVWFGGMRASVELEWPALLSALSVVPAIFLFAWWRKTATRTG